jgi:hypothetical protein
MSEQGNPLAMSPGAAPSGDEDSAFLSALGDAHGQSRARFNKLTEADARLGAVRSALDSLVKLGDTVSQEDVVKAAGGLVGAGLSAPAIASMLADMPPDGEALQGWIAQQDQGVKQREAQLKAVTGMAQHQMGVEALRALIGHAAVGHAQRMAAQAASAGPLAIGGGNAG